MGDEIQHHQLELGVNIGNDITADIKFTDVVSDDRGLCLADSFGQKPLVPAGLRTQHHLFGPCHAVAIDGRSVQLATLACGQGHELGHRRDIPRHQ